jgi:hypothetical protein
MPTRLLSLATAAARRIIGGRTDGLVHDPPDGTGAAPTFGAAPKAAIDLAGRPHGAFGRNGSDLMIRDDVARAHDHDGTPRPLGDPAFLLMRSFKSAPSRMRTYPCHFAADFGKPYEMKSF